MEKQRLDKIIASTGKWSRREVKALVRQGRVLVDAVGVPEVHLGHVEQARRISLRY